MWSEIGFESLCKFASGQHDVSSTTLAFQPNVCTETDHCPFIGTARVLFAQAQVVIELQVGKHRNTSIQSPLNMSDFVYRLCLMDEEDYILNYDKLRAKNPPNRYVRSYGIKRNYVAP